ncbi:hypothetical protein RHMOL_Rhmol06G0217400 [Rhododendron molle]|uniref:Uncharacterized protein n=1 Tax=Rhododendron molle TaxID=49168 RepID=A0ACC0NGV3_RHOML|nr:hypothetical protein RHMOL_Rhmol06G0217400 [Rhododendron molle]
MVVHAPFLRWDVIWIPSLISKRRALYYLETAGGERVVAAVQMHGENNRLIYEPLAEFVEEYQGLLNLGDVTKWSFGFQLNAWLDNIVYHSFVQYSEEVVDQCWYMKDFSLPTIAKRLPHSLQQHFKADGSSTWVILRHGLKAWSIEIVNHEFRNGWDVLRDAHGLKKEHKIVFACERKWVFHTIMFNGDGRELVFDWGGPNGHWQDLPPPTGAVHTACLPSTLMAYNTVVKFVYFNAYGPELHTVCIWPCCGE